MAKQNLENGATFGTQRAKINENFTEVYDGLTSKVDKDGSKVLSDVNFTTTKDTKLSGIAAGATANQTNAYLVDRANHTGVQAISTVTDLQTSLDGKLSSDEEIPADILPSFSAQDISAIFDMAYFEIVNGKLRPLGSVTPYLAQTTVTFGTSTSTSNIVNWTAVTNATSYVVQRSLNSNMSSSTTVYTGALLTYTDTGLTSSTTYYYTVTASATGYTSSVSDIASKSTEASGGSVSPKFIDSGLTSGTSTYNSQVFENDTTYITSVGNSSLYTDPTTVTGTSYSAFYQSVRLSSNGPFTHTIPSLGNGNYTVHLHYRAFSAGGKFNITINGNVVGTAIAVDVEAGGVNKALIKSYNITVSGGSIVIIHAQTEGQCCLAGFEIVAQGTASKLA